MRIRIQAWRYAGAVARSLAEKLEDLGVLVLRNTGSTFKARPGDLIINYGTADKTHCIPGVAVLNHPDKVAARYNKLDQYKMLAAAEVPMVRFTTEKRVAYSWLNDGYDVFCRLAGNSCGGHGIRLYTAEYHANTEDDLPDATVYTRRFRARREYRVHVFGGVAIDVSQKLKQDGREPNAIRSFDNGYVYAHNNVEEYPQSMKDAAIKAVAALGLDFGAVDILLMDSGNCAVLEVNTAPGMEGTTLDRFAEAVRQRVNGTVGL
jgi:glutathione synthase/RimK-type ligase-like ATP-grasp enzyme